MYQLKFSCFFFGWDLIHTKTNSQNLANASPLRLYKNFYFWVLDTISANFRVAIQTFFPHLFGDFGMINTEGFILVGAES